MEQTTSRAGVDPRVLKHIRTTARHLTGDKAIPGMDAQDIEQDLVLDLWRRRAAFDPSRATFRTFADRVVAHRVATLTGPTVRLAAKEQRSPWISLPLMTMAMPRLLTFCPTPMSRPIWTSSTVFASTSGALSRV